MHQIFLVCPADVCLIAYGTQRYNGYFGLSAHGFLGSFKGHNLVCGARRGCRQMQRIKGSDIMACGQHKCVLGHGTGHWYILSDRQYGLHEGDFDWATTVAGFGQNL